MSGMWGFRDRFPLEPADGVALPHDDPSPMRPWGMDWAVLPHEGRPAEIGKHDKPTGTKSVAKPTEYTDDSKVKKDSVTETHRD